MSDVVTDYSSIIFAKTAIGQHEIQTRSLSLPPLSRRVLVMVDGKKSSVELAAFVVGHSIETILGQLVEQGCIEARAVVPAAPPKAPSVKVVAAPQDNDVGQLPPPETRSAKDREMSRTFMTNTVNTIFGHNTRISLIKAIYEAQTVEDLRRVYVSWTETMSASSIGAKRLPELKKSLFQYL